NWTDTSKMSGRLSSRLFMHILTFGGPLEAARFQRVCTGRRLPTTQLNTLWRILYERDFGHLDPQQRDAPGSAYRHSFTCRRQLSKGQLTTRVIPDIPDAFKVPLFSHYAITPNGQFLVTAGDRCQFIVYDTRLKNRGPWISLAGSRVLSVTCSDQEVIFSQADGRLTALTLPNLVPSWQISTEFQFIGHLKTDGKTLVFTSRRVDSNETLLVAMDMLPGKRQVRWSVSFLWPLFTVDWGQQFVYYTDQCDILGSRTLKKRCLETEKVTTCLDNISMSGMGNMLCVHRNHVYILVEKQIGLSDVHIYNLISGKREKTVLLNNRQHVKISIQHATLIIWENRTLFQRSHWTAVPIEQLMEQKTLWTWHPIELSQGSFAVVNQHGFYGICIEQNPRGSIICAEFEC